MRHLGAVAVHIAIDALEGLGCPSKRMDVLRVVVITFHHDLLMPPAEHVTEESCGTWVLQNDGS